MHEESAAAVSILRLLADEVGEQTYLTLINAGTRPLIMIEVPQMVNQATEMKLERDRQGKSEDMQNQPIEVIIEEQNIPVPVERWINSSIMLPTRYLAAMVYCFVFTAVDPKRNVTNKGIAELFKLSPSNLHKLVSGKKYHGRSYGEGRKARSVEELEDHGEKMVVVSTKKGSKVSTSKESSASVAVGSTKGSAMKSKVMVTKTVITPHLVPLEFFKETPVLGTRGARKKKKEEKEPKGE